MGHQCTQRLLNAGTVVTNCVARAGVVTLQGKGAGQQGHGGSYSPGCRRRASAGSDMAQAGWRLTGRLPVLSSIIDSAFLTAPQWEAEFWVSTQAPGGHSVSRGLGHVQVPAVQGAP